MHCGADDAIRRVLPCQGLRWSWCGFRMDVTLALRLLVLLALLTHSNVLGRSAEGRSFSQQSHSTSAISFGGPVSSFGMQCVPGLATVTRSCLTGRG